MSKFGVVAMIWMLSAVGVSAPEAGTHISLSSAADFRNGNDEGGIAFIGDRVTLGRSSAGALDTWQSATHFGSVRDQHTSFAHNGFLYAIGGGGAWERIVSRAPIDANGSIGSWTSTESLPIPRRRHSTVIYNGFVYAIGGLTGSGSSSDLTLVAPLNGDGTVGTWSVTEPLPAGRDGHASVAHNGHLYVLGGNSGGPTNSVLFASFKGDGTLGTWTSTTALPQALTSFAAVVQYDRLCVIGGYAGNPAVQSNLVQVARIWTNGSLTGQLDDWETTAFPMPAQGRVRHCAAVHGGFVYVWNGSSGLLPVTPVLVAPLNPGEVSGFVGPWSTTTPLTTARLDASPAVYNDFLYSVGGSDGINGGEVFAAPVLPDSANLNQEPSRRWGVYSHLLDLGSDYSNVTVKVSGGLNKPTGAGGHSVIVFRARLAPAATAVFGPVTNPSSISLDTAIPISGTGRYLWLRLSLRDFGHDPEAEPTFVSKVEVNRPPTADAGPDQTVNATGPSGATVTLDGSRSSDPDGDELTYCWTGFQPNAFGVSPQVTFPLGTTYVLLTVNDPSTGPIFHDDVFITVVDSTPPAISSVTASPATLSPADNSMREVTVAVSATDAVDVSPESEIISVSSNQPVGSEPDWEITSALAVNLRAARSDDQTRVYTITVRCTDASGNSSTSTATVTVP